MHAVSVADTPLAEQQRIAEILRRLKEVYPDARCSLNFRTPLELLVATILAAQCTDERVNMVTPALFRTYPTAAAYAAAPREELEAAIRSTGFYRNKAQSIQGACRRIVEEFGGEVPQTMDELLTLPGVARKTANVVLSNAFGKAEGIAVDTHVARLSGRLGLTSEKAPEKIEAALLGRVPRAQWGAINHLLIYHGRAVCKAPRPQCGACVLADLCPSVAL
jgi:endonuclease-3